MAKTMAAAGPSPQAEISERGIAYLDGAFVPFGEAKISVAAHVINYGTGVFEGIRAYWNAAQEQLYLFRCREHFERMTNSARLLRVRLPGPPEELVETTRELLRRNDFHTDVYVRPLAYKAGRVMKVALDGIRDGFAMYAFPVGAYLPVDGLKAAVSSWRRISDNSVPARGKLTGAYINTSLAVDDVAARGADEAIFLTEDGHVSEGGGANLFVVRDGALVTTPVSADILEGVTRDCLMALARETGLRVAERAIDRTELYVADEVFFTGTGAQVAPCVAIDGRPVGTGRIGPIAKKLAERYFAAARGDDPAHAEWRVAVYDRERR
jgi:branched-chain amino acid aminotransferase